MSDGDLWALYRSFLSVMQTGSLSRAAAALGLSQPTLGRHIEALEAQLGGAPLERGRRSAARCVSPPVR